jgi:3-isopropylmalate/(R)-2-methylmalate dehydratase large subunit
VLATLEIVRDLLTVRFDDQTVWRILIADALPMIESSGCAARLGGAVGTFSRMNAHLKCIRATNRNFPGRIGHNDTQAFVASPATVAASARTGKIPGLRGFALKG